MRVGPRNLPCPAHARAGPYLYLIIFILLWLAPGVTFAINNLSLTLGRIEFNNLTAEDVALVADIGNGDSVALIVTAAKVTLSASLVVEQFEIRCEAGQLTTTLLSCAEGTYNALHQQYGNLSGRVSLDYRLDGSTARITFPEIAIGTGKIAGSLAYTAGGWTVDFQASNLGLTSLHKIADVFAIWPADYADESGAVDVDISIAGSPAGLQRMQGTIRANAVGFYGAHAAETLSGEVNFDMRAVDGWQTNINGKLDSGSLFVDSGINVGNIRPGLAFEITEQPLSFVIDMNLDRIRQRVAVRQLDIDHPGVMLAHVQGDADWREKFTILSAEVGLSVQHAGEFYTTYLQPFLLDTKFNALETTGSFETSARMDTTGFTRLDLQFTDIHAYDKNDRFNIAGLNGTFRVTDATAPVESGLTWDGAGLYRLTLGAGKLALESSQQMVNIVSWEDVPVLDGELQINSLGIINPGEADMTIKLDGALTSVSMADFTGAMGWPIMSGELTAAIEGLSFNRGKLVVDGQINLGLFDGNVYVRNLRIENLFGLIPTLYADIDIDMLDLELLTNRFTFGQIQGHLSGKVHKLELQGWEPVYFEAELATPEDDPTRHRISAKAVDNLGTIGGGAGGGLSSGFLRVFKNYSYRRIGLSCRLYNGSCEMGGVETTPEGFIIVSRGGLLPPWIEVRGTGHSIAWKTLVEGLKSITTNQPEIN